MSNFDTRKDESKIALPLPPSSGLDESDMAVYARFMRHLRCVPSSKDEIKILSAIQFTADMMDYSDAHVARILVDLGIRAPRMAFPADFLEFVDKSLLRSGFEVNAPSASILELKSYWDRTGEDKFAAFRREHTLLNEETFI